MRKIDVLTRVWVCALVAVARPGAADDQDFDRLAGNYLRELASLHPVSATLLGDHRFDGELDQVSEAQRRRELKFCRRYLGELARTPRGKLSRGGQVDLELLAHDLRYTIWRLDELREWAWNPLVYTRLAGNAVYGLVAREFAPFPQRLSNVSRRLEEFPRVLRQVRETLVPKRVPRVHAATAVKQNSGVLSIIEHMVVPHRDELGSEERRRLEKAIETARKAIETHQEWLEKQLLPAASGDFRIGRELYRKKLSFALHTPLTAERIRARALSELAAVREEMWKISQQVYKEQYPFTEFPKTPSGAYQQAIIRACLELAYKEKPARGRILESAKLSLAECVAFVREKDLITVPPDPVEIIVMPEFRRGVSLAYCDSPGPLDVGQKTFYAVAPLPESWTAKQVESFLREYNTRSVHNLTVHEAMPGHFLQLAHSNRYPSTLRAVLSSGVFVEGWAVYTERMMVEEGFQGGDPLMRLIVLKWYLRGIANALIDQAIHAGGMTRDEAMELMIEKTFQEEREAAGKWVRAQLTSAQLSTYFVGYQEHRDLRQEVRRRRGEKFNLKAYHDQALSYGSPPVQFVRALMLDLEIPSASF